VFGGNAEVSIGQKSETLLNAFTLDLVKVVVTVQ